MASHQFRDLPQIPQCMDDSSYNGWSYSYTPEFKQYTVQYSQNEDMYFDNFDDGRVSMQPMQRFMVEQSPLTPGLLHANIPLQTQFEMQYEQQWSPMYPQRYTSPDRTSASGNSSYATQNEVCSPPQLYHISSCGSPENFALSSLSYPTAEHMFERVSLSKPALPSGSISLRELEYEPIEPEMMFEKVNNVDVKQEVVYKQENCSIDMDISLDSTAEYADSGIGSSVRDAEEVQLIEFPEDPSSDSDYSPSSIRTSKRRRCSSSSGSLGRGQKRRIHGVKESAVSRSPNSKKPGRKPRKASNATKSNTEAHGCTGERRSFPCTLAMYGCTSTFSSKNEWGRHLRTQHVKLGYWRCTFCPPTTDVNDPETLYYNDFNRKDLFTQHLRRMHAAPMGSSRNARDFPVTEENLHEHQKQCYLQLRIAPQQSSCLFCEKTFTGPSSWEERIDHVGRHLEKDRRSGGNMVDVTAWNKDTELEQYLCAEGLIMQEQGQLTIGDGKPRRRSSSSSSSSSSIDMESDEE